MSTAVTERTAFSRLIGGPFAVLPLEEASQTQPQTCTVRIADLEHGAVIPFSAVTTFALAIEAHERDALEPSAEARRRDT
jgi:hypothetical protein